MAKARKGTGKAGAVDFEAAMARLEEIVEKLEEGGLTLRDSVALYEEGQKLRQACDLELNAAEERVTVLLGRGKGQPDQEIEIGPDEEVADAMDDALGEG